MTALEQACPQGPFQALDTVADGRLGQREAIGGLAEAAQLRDDQERLQFGRSNGDSRFHDTINQVIPPFWASIAPDVAMMGQASRLGNAGAGPAGRFRK